MGKCCSNCFNDKLISSYIEIESNEYGNCEYCNSLNVKLVTPNDFVDAFEIFFDLYTESNDHNAQELSKLIQSDWSLFSNDSVASILTIEILDYVNGKKYVYADIEKLTANIWEDYREEIKHNNRFFPKSTVDLEELKSWIRELSTNNYPENVYRARISEDKRKIKRTMMGKPPKKVATGGRANPIGISYLYVASDKETAIAEIRPHKGDYVSVVKMSMPEDLNLVDLRSPKNSLSPFAYMDDDNMLKKLFQNIELLQKLSEELSKPILPREAHLEYLPSQYLAELIKDSGFDGIIYKSSVGNGDNIALFDDQSIEFKNVKLYEVKNLNFESTEYK